MSCVRANESIVQSGIVCYDDNALMSDSDDRVMLNGVIRQSVRGLYERMMCVCTSLVV